MSADLSSPDDDDDDDDDDEDEDIIITLLLLAACDLSISKKALFHESLTVDDIRRRRSGKIRHHALQHQLASPFWTLFNSKHDDALITLCGFDHASFELLHQLLFKPYFDSFTPCKKRNSLSRIQQQNLVDPKCCVPSVFWHGLKLVDPI